MFRRVSELLERSAGAPNSTQCQARLRLPRHVLPPFLEAARMLLTLVMEVGYIVVDIGDVRVATVVEAGSLELDFILFS